ncbi:MAG TPA: GAF domain-containing protein, partial [Aggregatilineales bacterium]|nr:GAF domain-containing protein [Aggregatilineales bacterium]
MPINIESIISLGQNIAFLLCLPLLCHFLWGALKQSNPLVVKAATGAVFALIAIIGMLSPLRVENGLILIDGRVSIIALAMVYSTPTGIIATLLIAAFRLVLGGGQGVPSAITTIFTAAVVGFVARRYLSVKLNQYQSGKLLLVGFSLVGITAFWAYASPYPVAWAAFQTNILPVSIWYPACTLLLGNLLAQEFIRQDIEDELRASKERYLSVVNDQLDLVVRWKPDGTLTFVNRAYSEFFGKSKGDLIGTNGLLLVDNPIQEAAHSLVADLTLKRPASATTEQLKSASGDLHWLEWTHHALYDDHGSLLEIQSVGHDTTERKQAELRLQYHADFQRLLVDLATRFINLPIEKLDQALTDALHETGEFLKAVRGRINVLVDENPALFTREYEWAANGLTSPMHTPEPVPDADVLLARLRKGEVVILPQISHAHEFPDVQRVTQRFMMEAIVFVPLLSSGKLLGAVTVAWDNADLLRIDSISLMQVIAEIYVNALDRKRNEEHIRNLNADLERRVVERTTELVNTNQQLVKEIAVRQDVERALRDSESKLRAILETSILVTGTLQLTEVVRSVLNNLESVVAHDLSNIVLYEKDEFILLGQQHSKADSTTFEELSTTLAAQETDNLSIMQASREPLILNQPGDCKVYGWPDREGPPKSYLGLPIVAGQEVIGFINLYSHLDCAFTPLHVDYLRIFALQAGVAIQNARLYRQAHAIATMEERQRLARELHDSVSQALFSASAIAESLPRVLEMFPEKID